MSQRQMYNESEPLSAGPAWPSAANLAARREEAQGHVRGGLDAIDRGLGEIGDQRTYLRDVRQGGGQ